MKSEYLKPTVKVVNIKFPSLLAGSNIKDGQNFLDDNAEHQITTPESIW